MAIGEMWPQVAPF